MSYELIIQKADALAKTFEDERPWQVDFLGHSAYQLRNFVVKQGNPTRDTQYRQCIRELWARKGALRQAKHILKTNRAKCQKLESEISALSLVPRIGFVGRWRDAEIASRAAEIEMLEGAVSDTEADIQHRITREIDVLFNIQKELAPADGDRDSVEHENWSARAKQTNNQQLLELVKKESE